MTNSKSILIGHIHTNIKKCSKGKKLLFSISGNKPSMVLLSLAPILRDKLNYEISVFNFKNPILEISNSRSKLVALFCEKFNIQQFEYSEELDINKENKRRASIKYKSLEIFKKINADAIIGSITKDKQIKTFLYEMCNGTNIDLIYKKIPKLWYGNIINPLLTVETKIIDNYVRENNIEYVDSPPFTRHEKFVQFSNEFYPKISEFPEYLENISKFATIWKPESSIIDETILLSSYLIDRQIDNDKIKKIIWKNFIKLENREFDDNENYYENSELRAMLNLSGIKEQKLSDKYIFKLIKLMKNAEERMIKEYLPEFYQMEINKNQIVITYKG